MNHDLALSVDSAKHPDINMEIEVLLDGKHHPYDMTVSPVSDDGTLRVKIIMWSSSGAPPLASADDEAARQVVWARYKESRVLVRRKAGKCED